MVVRSTLEEPIHALLAAGDRAKAAEALVVAYGREVLGRCRTLVRDPAAAEDLAQDVFCRAFTGLAGFRGDASLRTWLFTIVRHVCIDHHRRTVGSAWHRDEAASAEDVPEESPFLIQLMVDRQELEPALDALDEADRTLVALRFVEGMEHAELASIFGLREGAVRMRLCRALARMRESIDAARRRTVYSPRLPRAPLGSPWKDRLAPPPRRRTGLADVGSPPVDRPAEEVADALSLPSSALRISFALGGFDDEEPTGRDALPPLAQALGRRLERSETELSVERLLLSLGPPLAELRREAQRTSGKKGWLDRWRRVWPDR